MCGRQKQNSVSTTRKCINTWQFSKHMRYALAVKNKFLMHTVSHKKRHLKKKKKKKKKKAEEEEEEEETYTKQH